LLGVGLQNGVRSVRIDRPASGVAFVKPVSHQLEAICGLTMADAGFARAPRALSRPCEGGGRGSRRGATSVAVVPPALFTADANPLTRPSGTLSPQRRGIFSRIFGVLIVLLLFFPRAALCQLTSSEEEKLQILTDPEALKKKIEKDKNKAPFEFFKSQVAPFDLLPYMKPFHWATLSMELRANDEDYEGFIQSFPVMMPSMPHELVFRREARLLKEKRARLPLQVNLMQTIPKEWTLELIRPGAIRADGIWQASLLTLEPHQMLVMILAKESTNQYAAWNRLVAMFPSEAERDSSEIEKQRYYRLVLPMDADKPSLSPHPLTWGTMSHVIWDGLPPDTLSVSQQQAMLDWLHWGGQIILTGGAGQAYSLLRESFLGPHLPADATGQTVPLSRDDLRPLSQSFPPPARLENPNDQSQPVPLTTEDAIRRFGRSYQAPAPIVPAPQRPVQLAVLRANPGSSTIPLGEASPHLLAVERRVGRGRLTMLAINPNDPALLAWPGLDTMIRRVVLRRPEEPVRGQPGFDGLEYRRAYRGRLLAHDLSWYRIMSRDAGLELHYGVRTQSDLDALRQKVAEKNQDAATDPEAVYSSLPGVADWRDFTTVPRLARDLLDQASGISIPSSSFVLRVLLAYVIAVVPLNWFICRFFLNRREWAWVIVPLVALGFAIGVERMAARNLGYDTASDEIDLLEVYSDYPRAHLTRLGSLYSTGRTNFTLSYPNDPTALALPMDTGRSIRGEQIAGSVFQSYPVPALVGLSVEPRSLSLYRAEQMLALKGPIRLEGDGENRKIVNESGQELGDATLVDMGAGKPKEWYLGTIAAGASVPIGQLQEAPQPENPEVAPGPDPFSFLSMLKHEYEGRSENQGELRLVAWVPETVAGQVIDPPVDRRRGFTAVVVHLRCGNPPSPESSRYNLLAQGTEEEQLESLKRAMTAQMAEDAEKALVGSNRRRVRPPAGQGRPLRGPGAGPKVVRPQ
jgi:hypothetical protein